MSWRARAAILLVASALAVSVTGSAQGTPAAAVPGGDVAATTAPRPPEDPGVGTPLRRVMVSSPDGSISCRRVTTEMVWLECLLRDTGELVRFGPDEFWEEVPCRAPHQSETCRLAFGTVYITRATQAQRARFDGARRIPLERLVELGRRTTPYPTCIADPNLGLSCQTNMDDQVGEQIFLGLAGSIWSCPGYEYVNGETPVPRGSDLCRVVRP